MSKRKKIFLITCAYCRKEIRHCDSERDHVPPQSIFPSPKPSNLVTVRCCATCHDELSRGDELLKAMISYGVVRPSKTQELKPSVDRAISRNPWWRKHLISGAEKGYPINLAFDDFSEDAIMIHLDQEFSRPLMITIERISKGLLFDSLPNLDTTNLHFEITQINETKIHLFEKLLTNLGNLPFNLVIGENLFFSMWGTVEGEPSAGVMLMSFHVGVNFFIIFGPPGYCESVKEKAASMNANDQREI